MFWIRHHDKPDPGQLQHDLGVHSDYSEPSPERLYTSMLPLVWEVDSSSLSSHGIRVSFVYRCLDVCTTLWLGVAATEDSPVDIELLLKHPLLDGTWPHVADAQFRLYQDVLVYPDIASFWAHPPSDAVLVADDLIAHQLSGYVPVTPLRSFDSSERPAFLLTTYEKPRIFGGYDEFARTILRSSLPEDIPDQLYVRIYSDDLDNVRLTYTLPSFTEMKAVIE